ncbi:hypothetical protein ANN_18352 [Periplaneta americana]|uniref:Uncharacterized protein n=1 Tax=Periplaneta americana TaxID=6978 RepID=A0ABQ8SQL8_PERAM|nr:hypothetical protein ANN_18352 [Periplaneta americana]
MDSEARDLNRIGQRRTNQMPEGEPTTYHSKYSPIETTIYIRAGRLFPYPTTALKMATTQRSKRQPITPRERGRSPEAYSHTRTTCLERSVYLAGIQCHKGGKVLHRRKRRKHCMTSQEQPPTHPSWHIFVGNQALVVLSTYETCKQHRLPLYRVSSYGPCFKCDFQDASTSQSDNRSNPAEFVIHANKTLQYVKLFYECSVVDSVVPFKVCCPVNSYLVPAPSGIGSLSDLSETIRSLPVSDNIRKKKNHLSTCFQTVHIPATTGVTVRIDFSCAAQQLNASQSTHRFSFVNHTIKTVNMPKVRHSVNLKSKLTSYISEFKEDGLSTDNKILFCNLCQCAVSSTQKFLVQQHITTSKHQANKQLNSKQRQLFLTQPTTSNVRSEFNIDLCRSLISADIPLYKLKNKVFREFLEKYTQHTIPDESTLRKTYAPSIYDETIQKIRDEIKEVQFGFPLMRL